MPSIGRWIRVSDFCRRGTYEGVPAMTGSRYHTSVSAVMLRQLDITLQKEYHQSLAEVLAELRLRNVLTEPDPAPEQIVSIMLHAHVLGRKDSPSFRQMRRALERFLAGSYGRCKICGTAISPAVLEQDPTCIVCTDCRSGELRLSS